MNTSDKIAGPIDLTSMIPWKEAVALGLVKDIWYVDKFGENPDVDAGATADIWEAGGVYPFSADGVADIVSISSNNAADTMDISVQGLDIDGKLVDQVITMTGTTRVALPTPLWRVFRMENVGSVDVTGIIYCYSGTENTAGVPSGASVTKAIINNGSNQTLMGLYTIPLGYVGFLYRGELGISRSGPGAAGSCAYYSRRYGGVFKVKKTIGLSGTGSNIFQDHRSFPDVVPALTDIKLTVTDNDVNNTGYYAAFDILLVPEHRLGDSLINMIGQPTST